MARASEPEEIDELPPLDTDDRDEAEGPTDAEPVPLVDPIEEDVELDEEGPPEMDVGIELEESDGEADDRGEIVLDIAELLAFAEERENAEEGDSAGPEGLDLGAGFEDRGEALTGSTEEGTDEPDSDLVSEELPSLDADEPGELEDDSTWLESAALSDEAIPPAGQNGWRVEQHAGAGSDFAALAITKRGIVASGARVVWIDRGAGTSTVSLGSTRATSIAAYDEQSVICGTAGGDLLRVERGGRIERVAGFRDALGLRPREGSGPFVSSSDPDRVLVHAGTSRLIESRDGGWTFTASELGGRIVSAAASAPPSALLLESEDGMVVVLRAANAPSFTRIALGDSALLVASGEAPMIAANGAVVALAALGRGLVVSSDSGRTFRAVPGSARATALAVGLHNDEPRVWVSLFSETDERALIVEADPVRATASVIAELSAPEQEDAESDDGRIVALGWDAASRCLWAASDAGLFAIRPAEPSA